MIKLSAGLTPASAASPTSRWIARGLKFSHLHSRT